MSKSVWSILFLILFMYGCSSAPKKIESYPTTQVKPVIDVYHGTKVVDPYRWLENIKSEEVKKWSKAQSDVAKKHLRSLKSRRRYSKKLTTIMTEKRLLTTA